MVAGETWQLWKSLWTEYLKGNWNAYLHVCRLDKFVHCFPALMVTKITFQKWRAQKANAELSCWNCWGGGVWHKSKPQTKKQLEERTQPPPLSCCFLMWQKKPKIDNTPVIPWMLLRTMQGFWKAFKSHVVFTLLWTGKPGKWSTGQLQLHFFKEKNTAELDPEEYYSDWDPSFQNPENKAGLNIGQ